MKHIGVVTVFPEMLQAVTEFGVTGRAIKQDLLTVQCWNPRDFTEDKHRTVDDRPYGGGPGMIMLVEPMQKAIQMARKQLPQAKVMHLSPQGRRLDQQGVMELAERPELILVSSRYEGLDERIIEMEVDEEWSIGDYVLSGGELAAMVMIDVLARTVPGVLGHEESASQDSFFDGLLDCPHYTRPEQYEGHTVPEVLLSGHHDEIRRWRLKQALGRTWQRRPDLLQQLELDAEQEALLQEYQQEHTN